MPTPIQITRIEKPNSVEWCPTSPEQFCRMMCPKPTCSEQTQCALRKGHCCDFDCVNPNDIQADLASCTFEDGETVQSGWNGPGKGDNYCNKCSCTDGVFMCTLMACLPSNILLPPNGLSPPGALTPKFAPELTTWTLRGPWDIMAVQKYMDDFQEIFADTLRADKSTIQSASVTPVGSEAEISISAFLNPMQAEFLKTPEFHSMLRANIESTADDLAKGMGYDTRAGSFILEGPWDVTAVEASSFELQHQFAKALGVPQSMVDVEITEDDFLVKIDFTAKNEGLKLAPLDNPQIFQQKLQEQIKRTNPALANVLGFGAQAMAPSKPKPLVKITECPQNEPDILSTCAGSLRCEYGRECCCGECFASRVYSCSEGKWASYFTDACMMPSCESKPDVKEETPGNPGLFLSAESIRQELPNFIPIIGAIVFGLMLGVVAAKGIQSLCHKAVKNEDVYTDLQADV